jgi:hypothetical protein
LSRDGAHDGAGRCRCAIHAEPRLAIGDDSRHVGQGLDVVDQGGGCDQLRTRACHFHAGREPAHRIGVGVVFHDLSNASAVRRGDPREGPTAVDGLEEPGLFAVEILAGPLKDGQLDALGPAGSADLIDRRTKTFGFGGE